MDSVEAVEKILNYSFTEKNLLKEAITLASCKCTESSPLYERLEYLGDAVLEVAFSNHLHVSYPNLKVNELVELRYANVSNEKFARAAVNHNLYRFLILEDPKPSLDRKIKEFSEAVRKEDGPVPFGGLVEAPKVLADFVESIAGAVYIDLDFDLQRFWEIFRGLLEPLYTLDDLLQKPEQTYLRLSRLGEKHGKRIEFRYSKNDRNRNIVEVCLGDKCIASVCAHSIDSAKLLAANAALRKLSKCKPQIGNVVHEDSLYFEPEEVKRKLFEIFSNEKLRLQTASSSLSNASESSLTDDMTSDKMVIKEDSLHVELEDVKRKLFQIFPSESLRLQTESSSLPTASEMTQEHMVVDEDSLHVEPEDVKRKLFEICPTEKLRLQTESSSLPTGVSEMTREHMVINEDSPHVETENAKGEFFENCSTRKLQIQIGSSSLPTASTNPLTYEMTIKQKVVDEVEPRRARGKLLQICAKNKWPEPIFSFEEKRGPRKKKKFVCSVKIEIPTLEDTFHMKGDAESTKKQAKNSSTYHMIRALKSSLMSLVINIQQMHRSLTEKKNPFLVNSEIDPDSVEAVEKILNYSFTNKNVLKEALLTHPSSGQRFLFLGNSALHLAFTKHIYFTYPKLEPNELDLMRSANTCNDRFARVAVKHGIYQYFISDAFKADREILEYIEFMGKEDDPVPFRCVKAPKILSELVDYIAGAVYIDVNLDVRRLWEILRHLFEPICTLDDLRRQPHPLLTLFCLAYKNNKRLEFKYRESIAEVYLDDEFIACGNPSKCRDTAKMNAAKVALQKLSETMPVEMIMNDDIVYEDAKEKLIEICNKRQWPNPVFSVENESSVKGYVYSVKIETQSEEGTLYVKGDRRKWRKTAENNSASHMIRILESSPLSLVISNLRMQYSLEEKKNMKMQKSLEKEKNRLSKKRKHESVEEKKKPKKKRKMMKSADVETEQESANTE